MTPQDLDDAIAAAYPQVSGIPPVRYAGARPPATLLWFAPVPGVGRVQEEAEATLAEVGAAVQAPWPPSAALDAATVRTLQLLHARLAREVRRADALVVAAPEPVAPPALAVLDLDLVAVLLDAARAARRVERGERAQAPRFAAELTGAATAWLDGVAVTPRTVDEPVTPLHETRCALARAGRSLVSRILHSCGADAPERM